MAAPRMGGSTRSFRASRMGGQVGRAPIPNTVRPGLRRLLPSALLGVARGRSDASDSTLPRASASAPPATVALAGRSPLTCMRRIWDGLTPRSSMLRAHERCPYSNATRGNVEVTLTVDGMPLAPAGASSAGRITRGTVDCMW